MQQPKKYEAIVVGTSAGGLYVLVELLQALPENYSIPIIIVQHRARDQRDLLEEILQSKSELPVKQADEKEKILAPCAYVAPADYHLLVERDRTFSLSSDELVRYSRPSIDVLFESASEVYGNKLVGIVLTGANADGADGIKKINAFGGLTIAQHPVEAQYDFMPKMAIQTGAVKHIWKLKEIVNCLINLM